MDSLIKTETIDQEFQAGQLRESMFPMLTDFGVPDYSELIHSYGLNYITAFGRTIEGITAVSECPIYAPDSPYREVRPDSVWFEKESNKPLLLAEFERYNNSTTKQRILKKKIQNLLIGYHQLDGSPEYLLLVYWSYSGITANGLDKLATIVDDGFQLPGGKYVGGINSFQTEYLIYHAIATGEEENIKLNKWIRVK